MSDRISIAALKHEFCGLDGPRDEWDPQVLALIEAVEAAKRVSLDVLSTADDDYVEAMWGLYRTLGRFDFDEDV